MRLVLSLVTVLALALAGCGDGTDGTASTDTSTDATPTEGTTTPVDDPADADDPTDADETGTEADDATDHAAAGDCSAAGLPVDADLSIPDEGARATAAFLLDAAVRCDEQLLFTAATESDTSFSFGSATVDQVFSLPEDPEQDPAPWEALARLLHGTTPVEADGIWTWPAAFREDAADDAWQELVDSGIYTKDQVDQLRAAPDGYLGWRVGIDADGTWLFFTAGD